MAGKNNAAGTKAQAQAQTQARKAKADAKKLAAEEARLISINLTPKECRLLFLWHCLYPVRGDATVTSASIRSKIEAGIPEKARREIMSQSNMVMGNRN